jgi:hypothetical protein
VLPTAGLYGAGGSGSNCVANGDGAQGIIVITYTPSSSVLTKFRIFGGKVRIVGGRIRFQ